MFREDKRKTALAYILNPTSLPSVDILHTPSHGSGASVMPIMSPISKEDMSSIDLNGNGHGFYLTESDRSRKKRMETYARASSMRAQKEKLRATVSRGRNSDSRCTYPNCTHGARLYNRCFHHGGWKLCKATGCSSKAKRFGFCWSHGGGRICDKPSCSKVAASGGFCWAHGGGNRCKVDGCNRRSYRKHNNFCKQHNGTQITRGNSV